MADSQKLNTYFSFVFLIRNQTQMDRSRGDQTRISTDTKLSPSFSTTTSMPMDLRPNQNQGEVFAFLLHSGTYSKYIVLLLLLSILLYSWSCLLVLGVGKWSVIKYFLCVAAVVSLLHYFCSGHFARKQNGGDSAKVLVVPVVLLVWKRAAELILCRILGFRCKLLGYIESFTYI